MYHYIPTEFFRFSFLLLSVFVPYLCSMTTMSFSVNDTVIGGMPIQSTKWSSSVPHNLHAPIYRHSRNSSVSSGNTNSLIKLRRLSSGHRNSQRKENSHSINIVNPAGLRAPNRNAESSSTVENVNLVAPSVDSVQSYSTIGNMQEIHNTYETPLHNMNHHQKETNNLYPYVTPPAPYAHESVKHHEKPMHYHEYGSEESEEHEEEPPEIEDKVFSKTIVATKALKIGKIIFAFFLILVVIILAILSQLGANLTPIVLPFALLPVGLIALALFIPLFFAFVPLVVANLAGGKKRRRRFIDEDRENILQKLESRVTQILDHWPAFLLSLSLQKYKNFSGN